VFEWDAAKAAANQQKHGVSFREAALAFSDPLAIDDADLAHGGPESRYFRLAWSPAGRLLAISYTQRKGTNDQETIRIISARPATRRERAAYSAI
jgi:uncharacterized protein